MSERRLFIVEVDAFDGEHRSLLVQDGVGKPVRSVYCVGRVDEATGVLHLVDYGYTSVADARDAWPEAN